MKKILVPIELNAASKVGIRLAKEMGQKINADIYLLLYNTCEDEFTDETNFSNARFRVGENKKYSEDVINSASQESISINTINYNQNFTDSLNLFLEEYSVDFVLIEIDKEKQKSNWLPSEFYIKLGETVNCPVITIIRPIDFNQINDIGIEFPARHILDSGNIRFLKQFKNIFIAKFHLLCVVDPIKVNNSEVIHKLSEISERSGLTSFSVNTVYNKDIVEGISFFSKKKKIDMAVIMNQKIQKINIDEIIYEVSDKTNCSVFCQF